MKERVVQIAARERSGIGGGVNNPSCSGSWWGVGVTSVEKDDVHNYQPSCDPSCTRVSRSARCELGIHRKESQHEIR